MSSRNKVFSLVLTASATLALSSFVSAQDDKSKTASPDQTKIERKMHRQGAGFGRMKMGRQGFDRHGMGRGGFAFRGIDLTDAQKAQIKAIHEANKPDTAVREELRTIAKARRDGTITDAQKARMEEIRKAARGKAESVHQQVLGVLTAEQKAKIDERKQKMKERFEEFRKLREQRKQQRTDAAPKKKVV